MSQTQSQESKLHSLSELSVNPLIPINCIGYDNVLPGGLRVLKFQDNCFNNGKHVANITDMGRTLNAVSYLASKWLCSRSKYVRSTILDSRGNWQIKRKFNPGLPVYNIKINQVMHNGTRGFTSLISPGEENIILHAKVNFLHLLNSFMQYYRTPDCTLTQLVINFQFVKYDNTRYYFLIDDIMLLDDCLFSWNDKPYPYQSYLTKLSKVQPYEVTEHHISECYNNIFKVLALTPGFNTYSIDKILFNCRTLEDYITLANSSSSGKYY